MFIVKLLPHNILKLGFLYGLALLACVRFSRPNLMLLTILFNTLIMMKAYPWEKYVMPLAVVFWYLKSLGLEDKFNIFQQQKVTQINTHSYDEKANKKFKNVSLDDFVT